MGHTSILHTDYWGLDRLSVPCHPVRKKKGQAMFHSKVCNFHLETYTCTSGVSIYKFGKNEMCGIIKSPWRIMTNFLHKFPEWSLDIPKFWKPSNQPQHSTQSIKLKFCKGILLTNVSQVTKKKKKKIPPSCITDHGSLYVSLGLPPALPRVSAWIPSLMNC